LSNPRPTQRKSVTSSRVSPSFASRWTRSLRGLWNRLTAVRTLSRALVSHFGTDGFVSRGWRVSAACTSGVNASPATTCGGWSPMAAGDSLDSQMPDALSGWVMVYPILIVGLAAALPRDGAQRHRCSARKGAREPERLAARSPGKVQGSHATLRVHRSRVRLRA
jgi:hypothetical protein